MEGLEGASEVVGARVELGADGLPVIGGSVELEQAANANTNVGTIANMPMLRCAEWATPL
ncbi:MAG: hypothetical protein GY722_12510 [bacterium]|nr:hypothetical protein [bacterium]